MAGRSVATSLAPPRDLLTAAAVDIEVITPKLFLQFLTAAGWATGSGFLPPGGLQLEFLPTLLAEKHVGRHGVPSFSMR
jgi:hypothetical protein